MKTYDSQLEVADNKKNLNSNDFIDLTPKDTPVKPKRKIKLKFIIISILMTLSVAVFKTGNFVTGNDFESVIYYARVPLSDGSVQVIEKGVQYVLPIAIVFFVFLTALIILCFRFKDKLNVFSSKNKLSAPSRQLKFLYKHSYFISFISILLSIVYIGNQTNTWAYIGGLFRNTSIYEENYEPPQNHTFVFPEEKKNLVYIMTESMEPAFSSTEQGGIMKENYIPNLTKLANENISFSDTEKLGGFQIVSGTGWTVASLIAQTSGTPLTIPPTTMKIGENNSFLPGAYSLGEILDSAGYNQAIVMGSKAKYAMQKMFHENHGNKRVFDYYTATGQAKWDYPLKEVLPKDYYVWWGIEDYRVFEYAKDEIEYLSKSDKPFHVNVITIDTHFYDGYKCPKCPDTYDNQYANVIACSDKQIYDFVCWIQNHPDEDISKNTVIVISGDHPTMDNRFIENSGNSNVNCKRSVYNCFINTGLSDEYSKNRTFTAMDMYPTVLSAIGVSWDSEKLGLGVNLFSGEKTLAEKIGIDNLSYELKARSDFYDKYIMKSNYSKFDIKSTK